MDCCSTTSRTVGVCSITRRKRNHDARGIRRVLCAGTSPRSRAIIPKPLLWSSRSVTFSICVSDDSQRRGSGFRAGKKFSSFRLPAAANAGDDGRSRAGDCFPQRTQSRRLISMPAAAADAGSRASLESTRAQTSPRWVARARAESSTLVLPEEAAPQISVRQPRAKPPLNASSEGMPLGTISGAGRTASREAGTSAASFGVALMRDTISAVSLPASPACERGADDGEKIKGRPVAAAENNGEADILFS